MNFELSRTKRKLRSFQTMFKITSLKADYADTSADDIYLARKRMKRKYAIAPKITTTS
jgi:hypothetical protein